MRAEEMRIPIAIVNIDYLLIADLMPAYRPLTLHVGRNVSRRGMAAGNPRVAASVGVVRMSLPHDVVRRAAGIGADFGTVWHPCGLQDTFDTPLGRIRQRRQWLA
jgi:hypothetical protein